MSSSQIVINSSHYDENENCYIYRFPQQQEFKHSDRIGLISASIYNSFFNVVAPNNVIKIDFPSSASDWITSGNIVVPEGFYNASSFSAFLQKEIYDRKFYTESGNNTLSYLAVGESATQYANTITTYAVPTSATPPSGASWSQLTGTQRSPRIYLGMIGPRFGFPADASLTTHYGYTEENTLETPSIITPQINPFNSIILTADCIQNQGLAYPANFLYSVPINASFGSLMTTGSHEPLYSQFRQGQYQEIRLYINDALMNRITPLRDTNITIVLSIVRG